MTVEKSRVERLIDQINSTNAKRAALLLVVCFSFYHGLLHLKYGIDTCTWLLSDGRYKANQEWQPYGCMLHRYTQIDTRRCFRYLAFYGKATHFVFMGDLRMRDLYSTFVGSLEYRDENKATDGQIEDNATHVDNKLKTRIDYVWAPYISNGMIATLRKWQDAGAPSVLIIGCGLSSIITSNGSLLTAQEYAINLTRLVQPFDRLRDRDVRVLWMLIEPIDFERVKHAATNDQIALYNTAAIEVLSYSAAFLWWSAQSVGRGLMGDSPDGVRLAPRALQHDAQILLNMYCNDYMNFNDGSCCSSAESYTTLQIVTFGFLGVCTLVATFLLLQRWILRLRGHEYTLLMDANARPLPSDAYTLFTSLATMALIMVYFFLCDRTNFFMKENKYYSEFSFWLPIGYVFALGLFFTEDTKFTKVLHRDQIDECKGWMQLVILVYHVTGAQVLPITMHTKVLISAYLFLVGYQQFCYVWQRGDFTAASLFKGLFQLNFVTVSLCLCMNRPYQFYNFVPLMSFWYVMCYCLLAVPPQITSTTENAPFYLVVKFVAFFAVITILFMSEVFFEKIFVTRPWKALFVTTDDDIHEWWSRWKLDRYSTLYGMIFSVGYLLATRHNVLDDNNRANLFSRGISLSCTLAGVIGIGSYVTFTFLCRSESDCSEIHSYIVFLPIISYILLRNISGVLRTRYSSFFAWFGRISLELFVGQYHIWLAADTHGVLVFVPGYPVLNVLITSFVFVCASHEVHRITKVLLPYAVPTDWKALVRNAILFLAVLVPIGINDGMF